MSVNGLIDQIRSAYERVPRPSNRELLHPQCADDNDIVWLHDVADWQSLVEADTEPDYASLAFLSPEGFRHFLPAYLIWALRHLDSDSVVLDSLVFHFRPGPENLEKFRKSKYSTFDADQLAAAEAALALIRMVVDSES